MIVPQIPTLFEDKWIDVGFWVMPDDRVSELETLESIRGRLYSTAQEPT